jgi:hypothetical protein
MTKRYALNAVFKRTVLGKYRRRSMSNMNLPSTKHSLKVRWSQTPEEYGKSSYPILPNILRRSK